MRYWVYDEDGKLLRMFWDKESAQRFMQQGWKLVTQPKVKRVVPAAPSPEMYGEALY